MTSKSSDEGVHQGAFCRFWVMSVRMAGDRSSGAIEGKNARSAMRAGQGQHRDRFTPT
jgi:hypothetical protein